MGKNKPGRQQNCKLYNFKNNESENLTFLQYVKIYFIVYKLTFKSTLLIQQLCGDIPICTMSKIDKIGFMYSFLQKKKKCRKSNAAIRFYLNVLIPLLKSI